MLSQGCILGTGSHCGEPWAEHTFQGWEEAKSCLLPEPSSRVSQRSHSPHDLLQQCLFAKLGSYLKKTVFSNYQTSPFRQAKVTVWDAVWLSDGFMYRKSVRVVTLIKMMVDSPKLALFLVPEIQKGECTLFQIIVFLKSLDTFSLAKPESCYLVGNSLIT